MNQELNIFIKEIEHDSYAEQYRRWQEYLKIELQSDNYAQLLGIFLQYFPFNCKYWLQFIELTKFEIYTEVALKRNPKSYELWTSYLHHCKLMYLELDKDKYKKELENALLEIGADSRALHLFQDYYELISQNSRYQFFKKIFTRALIGLESMYDKFQIWFSTLPESSISSLANKEFKRQASNYSVEEQRGHLKDLIKEIYQKTLGYRGKRIQLQNQITHLYFDGSQALVKEKSLWRDLIELERENGIVENISYAYERSLMAQTDDVEFWDEVFHYMENETNKYTKVLNILRNNKLFFMKFDLNIYFYWCDLEERENVSVARQLFQKMIKIKPTFEVYERLIQLQIRQKQWNNAQKIYDTLLKIYQQDIDMLCYILVEYAQFIVKYYKELDYAKQLLKGYFNHLPFNHYLYTKYLQFIKNFQNNQGFYEDLMQFILDALKKAKKTLNEVQFVNLNKITKFYLRSTLSSIYLIKLSEHKMLEVSERSEKEQDEGMKNE